MKQVKNKQINFFNVNFFTRFFLHRVEKGFFMKILGFAKVFLFTCLFFQQSIDGFCPMWITFLHDERSWRYVYLYDPLNVLTMRNLRNKLEENEIKIRDWLSWRLFSTSNCSHVQDNLDLLEIFDA